jgi:hypothetical protein
MLLFAVITAVTTFITPVGKTSKQILQGIGEGEGMTIEHSAPTGGDQW